jgi:hypothetical protein
MMDLIRTINVPLYRIAINKGKGILTFKRFQPKYFPFASVPFFPAKTIEAWSLEIWTNDTP